MSRVPLTIGINAPFPDASGIAFVKEAEALGADSLWAPEFWGYDAFTPLAFYAAHTSRMRLATGIVQLGARTPTMLAMSAMSMQALSGGRFILGLGTSGPQVMEGWHGVRFDRPIARTGETIDIVRAVTKAERVEYHGGVYELPLPGGQGKALRSAAAAAPVPVYVASLGPENLKLTGAKADGWIGNSFFPESADVFFGPIREGALAAGRSLSDVELTVAAGVEFTDDVDRAGRRHANGYAFTFGAMGSATKNFYADAFARQGYGDVVAEVGRQWRAGDREAAAAAVPIEIGIGTNLIGTPTMVKDRLRAYRDIGVSTLRVGLHIGDPSMAPGARARATVPDRPRGVDASLDVLGQLLDLVREVNADPVV